MPFKRFIASKEYIVRQYPSAIADIQTISFGPHKKIKDIIKWGDRIGAGRLTITHDNESWEDSPKAGTDD